MKRIPYYHLGLNITTTNKALKELEVDLNPENHSGQAKLLFFINAHCFNLSIRNKAYLQALQYASYVFNDGIGIKIGAKFKGIDLLENMNGTDFIPKIINLCADQGKKIFLLGAAEGIAELAAGNIRKKHPLLSIAGYKSGFFSDSNEIIKMINDSGADVLIVGMGVPKQELWLYENQKHFQHIKLAIAGGAIIDFIAAKVKRAPVWLQKLGLEWFYRFVQEPKRLFKRYFIGNILFFFNLLYLAKFNKK